MVAAKVRELRHLIEVAVQKKLPLIVTKLDVTKSDKYIGLVGPISISQENSMSDMILSFSEEDF